MTRPRNAGFRYSFSFALVNYEIRVLNSYARIITTSLKKCQDMPNSNEQSNWKDVFSIIKKQSWQKQ
jgi:hypothetical protein